MILPVRLGLGYRPSLLSIPTPLTFSLFSSLLLARALQTPADILLGRGNRVLNHPGNEAFRRLVASRKGDYTGADGNASKNEVARQVFECVRTGTGIPTAEGEAVAALPGRFMKKEGGEESDLWDEVTDDVALEKCKMALRQIDRREMKKAARAAARAAGTTVTSLNAAKKAAKQKEDAKRKGGAEGEKSLPPKRRLLKRSDESAGGEDEHVDMPSLVYPAQFNSVIAQMAASQANGTPIPPIDAGMMAYMNQQFAIQQQQAAEQAAAEAEEAGVADEAEVEDHVVEEAALAEEEAHHEHEKSTSV